MSADTPTAQTMEGRIKKPSPHRSKSTKRTSKAKRSLSKSLATSSAPDDAMLTAAAAATSYDFAEETTTSPKTTLKMPQQPLLLFSKSQYDMEGKASGYQASLRSYRGPITLAKETHLEDQMSRRLSYPNPDKERRAIANLWIYRFGNLSDDQIEEIIKPHIQHESQAVKMRAVQKKYVTECRKLACDAMKSAMEALYQTLGKDALEGSTVEQRHRHFGEIYDSSHSAIDEVIWSKEKGSVDFIGIEADQASKSAKTYRAFNRYKFVRLAEATMYNRVWKFQNRKAPVFEVWNTMCKEAMVKEDLAVPEDVGEIPAQCLGARAVNHRPRPRMPAPMYGLSSVIAPLF
ncbi:unnamed protein product [Zymoseptoria tritici ST99CH_3D1]|nr:unnamed protein product [Zymoseptoria tritici ST99CH_3D1]